MTIDRRKVLALLGAVPLAAPRSAWAQSAAWPAARPIRLLVGFPPGGSIDTLARAIADQLGQRLSASVVVENRTGAAGMLAAEETARQPADGYTLLLIPGGPLLDNPPVDVFDDKAFTQIVKMTDSPVVVAVSATTPYASFKQLIDAAKAASEPLSFASSGIGSLQHLVGEMIAEQTGAKLGHVPYRGGGQAISDLVAGHLPIGMLGVAPLLPHIQAGRIRALAVSGEKRVGSLPEVPTLKEVGVDVAAVSWTSLAGPKDLPAPVTARLAREVEAILAQAEVRARLEPLGLIPNVLSGPGVVAYTRADRDMQMKIVRERKIPLQ